MSADAYSAAVAFLEGRLDVPGNLFEVLGAWAARPQSGWRHSFYAGLARLWWLWPESWYQSRGRARSNIEFHYDHDPAFYRQFLDERLVYSCAYFESPELTLDQAQLAKLDHICRKLDLQPEERFLDVGCGFGALVARAAEHYGALAIGCTLSRHQFETASKMLPDHASVQLADYRDLLGTFDKIASVGMFEHVGVRRLRNYFAKINGILAHEGRFLNHGIARPQTVKAGPDWVFLQRKVFPGGELPHLSDVIREAENAGFEVLDVENLRPHYARTCRCWAERLMASERECRKLVGLTIYRTWLLYLAMSSLNFESGLTEVHQVLMAKRSSPRPRHWTRRYIYP